MAHSKGAFSRRWSFSGEGGGKIRGGSRGPPRRAAPPAAGAFPRSLPASGLGGAPTPRPPRPAPGSILPATGLGCDAASAGQVRNGSPYPSRPPFPWVTLSHPRCGPPSGKWRCPACVPASRAMRSLWASRAAASRLWASGDRAARRGRLGGGALGWDRGGGPPAAEREYGKSLAGPRGHSAVRKSERADRWTRWRD